MESCIITCIVVAGMVTIYYLITKKNVKRQHTMLTFGNIFEFKSETEFDNDDENQFYQLNILIDLNIIIRL